MGEMSLALEAEDTVNELHVAHRAVPFSTARFGASVGGCDGRRAVVVQPLRAQAALTNAAEVSTNVAVIERGGVSFVEKARRAQAAGAAAVLFVNTDEELFVIGGEDGDEDISIPVVMIRASDGSAFMADIMQGKDSVYFSYEWSSSSEEDSDEEGECSGFTSWGTPTPRVDADARDGVMAEIKLAAGWHSLKPVPKEATERQFHLDARDMLMLSLRRGRELLQKVRTGQVNPSV